MLNRLLLVACTWSAVAVAAEDVRQFSRNNLSVTPMLHRVMAIGGVKYETESEALLVYGAAQNRTQSAAIKREAKPWCAEAKVPDLFIQKEGSYADPTKTGGNLYTHHFFPVAYEDEQGFQRVIALGKSTQGLVGTLVALQTPQARATFEKSTHYPFVSGDVVHGVMKVSDSRFVISFYRDKTRDETFQMTDATLATTDGKTPFGKVSYGDQKGVVFHVAALADKAGLHSAFSTQADGNGGRLTMYRFRFPATGLKDGEPPLKNTFKLVPSFTLGNKSSWKASTQSGPVSDEVYAALASSLDPLQTYVGTNKKGNTVFVFVSRPLGKKETTRVGFLEATPEGALVKLSIAASAPNTDKQGSRLQTRVFEDEGRLYVSLQKSGRKSGEDFEAEVLELNLEDGSVKKRRSFKCRFDQIDPGELYDQQTPTLELGAVFHVNGLPYLALLIQNENPDRPSQLGFLSAW